LPGRAGRVSIWVNGRAKSLPMSDAGSTSTVRSRGVPASNAPERQWRRATERTRDHGKGRTRFAGVRLAAAGGTGRRRSNMVSSRERTARRRACRAQTPARRHRRGRSRQRLRTCSARRNPRRARISGRHSPCRRLPEPALRARRTRAGRARGPERGGRGRTARTHQRLWELSGRRMVNLLSGVCAARSVMA